MPTQSQVSYFNCSKTGHYASSCPLKSSESRRFPNLQYQRSQAVQSVPANVTDQAFGHANNFRPSSASLLCPLSQRSQLRNEFNKYSTCMAGCTLSSTDPMGQALEVTTQEEPVHPNASSSINCDTALPKVIRSKFNNMSVSLLLYPTKPIKIAVLEQEIIDYQDLNGIRTKKPRQKPPGQKPPRENL